MISQILSQRIKLFIRSAQTFENKDLKKGGGGAWLMFFSKENLIYCMRYLSKILHIICQDSSLRPPPEQDGSELTQEPAQENRLKRLFTILEKRTERETI